MQIQARHKVVQAIYDTIDEICHVGPKLPTHTDNGLLEPTVIGFVPTLDDEGQIFGSLTQMNGSLLSSVRHALMASLDQRLGGVAKGEDRLLRPGLYKQFVVRFKDEPKVTVFEAERNIKDQWWLPNERNVPQSRYQKTVRLEMYWLIERKKLEL